jgi:hypothetical protein
MYYRASKTYLAATLSALVLAIMCMVVVITTWSMTPEIAADTSELKLELRQSLQR